MPVSSPRRGRADAAPFFRLALRLPSCRRRLAHSHAAPSAPTIPTPPIPPARGGLCRLRLLGPRRSFLRSSPRADRTGDKASKSQSRVDAQKTSPPGAHSMPPLTPPRLRRRGAGRLRLRGAKHFLGAGAAGKDRTARVGAARASPAGAAAPPRYHTPRPCLPPWPCKNKRRRPLSAQKNVGGAQHGPANEAYIIGRLFHICHSKTLQIARQRPII